MAVRGFEPGFSVTDAHLFLFSKCRAAATLEMAFMYVAPIPKELKTSMDFYKCN